MLKVTERARQELKNTLIATVDEPKACYRLFVNPQCKCGLPDCNSGQIGLSIGMAMPSDYVVEHAGSAVLVMGQILASDLEDITMDIDDTPEGPRLVIFKESLG